MENYIDHIGETVEELSKKFNRPLNIKLGMDPTSPDLHLGHFILLKHARKLQDKGHKVILIIGDYTAQIGDPSGKDKLRPKLSVFDVSQNSNTYFDQAMKILDSDKTIVKYNSKWLNNMNLTKVLDLSSLLTLQKIISKDSFSKRLEKESPVFMHETIYPLLQGYDSVVVKADVELGGNDQLFNLQVGRQVQKGLGQFAQTIITFPLLVGLDGKRKMSKSLGNDIPFNGKSKDKFGKVMSISDEIMDNWIEILDVFSDEERKKLDLFKNPKNKKLFLAQKIVEQFHGQKLAKSARTSFENQFSKKDLSSVIEELSEETFFIEKNTNLNKFIKDIGFASSNQDGLRKIKQNAVKINNEKTTENIEIISLPTSFVIQVGKKNIKKITVKLKNIKKNSLK